MILVVFLLPRSSSFVVPCFGSEDRAHSKEGEDVTERLLPFSFRFYSSFSFSSSFSMCTLSLACTYILSFAFVFVALSPT